MERERKRSSRSHHERSPRREERSPRREERSPRREERSPRREEGSSRDKHPCERIFGSCKAGDDCLFKDAPREACVSFLKGKCRFGNKCKEPHFLLFENKYIPAFHPCVRIFGACKFGDDCECALLPSTTCLKYVRGKCSFGDRCKELHPAFPGMLAPALSTSAALSASAPLSASSSAAFPFNLVSQFLLQQQLQQQQMLQPAYKYTSSEGRGGTKRGRDSDSSQPPPRQAPYFQQQQSSSSTYQQAQGGKTVLSGVLHPCVRIFGRCSAGQQCKFVAMPIEACVRYLKGECKFGEQCKEVHVDTGNNGRHPCARIFGFCKVGCRYQDYPVDSCLQYLKGKCKFGDSCREVHASRSTDD